MLSPAQFYENIHTLLHQQDFGKAERLCADYCEKFSTDSEAWFLFGVTRHLQGNIQLALTAFERAAQLDSNNFQALNAQAMMLSLLGKYDSTLNIYQYLQSLNPNDAQIPVNIAVVYEQLKQFERALEYYDLALKIDPHFFNALLNRGLALTKLDRIEEALQHNRDLVSQYPQSADAHFNLAEVLLALDRYQEALGECTKVLAINPKHVKACLDRGFALAALGKFDAAKESFSAARKMDAQQYRLFKNKFDSTFDLIENEIDPRVIYFHRLYEMQKYCDWSRRDELINAFEGQIVSTKPPQAELHDRNLIFFSLSLPVKQPTRLQLARNIARSITSTADSIYTHMPRSPERLRIGYVSPDFRAHPVAFLTRPMYGLHDRERFKVYGYSLYNDDSEVRKAIERGCDVFREVSDLNTKEIARIIYEDQIDLLIDLSGYYDFTRSEIFAYRPAPVQLSYCGFPCTTGADYMDYLILDQVVCPPASEQFIAEQIAYMPSTYFMVNDNQKIDDKVFTRSEMGLPEEALVFCCFNSPYKIDPVVFDIWMNLLKQIPQSVLWLYADKGRVKNNLIAEAKKRGVDSQRIIFASAMSHEKHLARYQLADLFLDTFWCNAHTTTADALWAGLPVLTCAGEGIQARVAASLLYAIELPELVTDAHESYEQKALYLAQHPDELTALRKKLEHNRSVGKLFNTELRVRELESAYVKMWQQFIQAKKPKSFYVTI